MRLRKIYISGFKSISNESPQTLMLDSSLTTLIGHNGTGKSTALEALNKLFSIDPNLRGLSVNDFNVPCIDQAETRKTLVIEAWFDFPKIDEESFEIPHIINQMVATDDNGSLLFRVRLEGLLTFDYSTTGEIEENIWTVVSEKETPDDEDKIRLNGAIRSAIQVNYIPANRDPLIQLKYSSKAILGRLLKSIRWSDVEKENFETKASGLNTVAKNSPALKQLSEAINTSWKSIYKGRYLKEADLNFPLSNIDEVLKLLQLHFNSDEFGNKMDASRLSDGQKSLAYFALTKALFDIDKSIQLASTSGDEMHFDAEKLKLPIFSIISLEEPENHLSPHYLGRIIKLILEHAEDDNCQAIISTHSASIVGRIEPSQIRHFSLNSDTKSTAITKLDLPKKEDDKSKYISEAVKAYPEIYFAKLVILGEGDSEQVILPKILEAFSTEIDTHSISIVPLGGRHVNHFWRLLESINIPYITLLDLDLDRNGGGFGRLNYAIKQLYTHKNVTYFHDEIPPLLPKWNDASHPKDFEIDYKDVGKVNIMDELEINNIFFSSPLDVDYSMIMSFSDIFCSKDEVHGERGPKGEGENESPTDKASREKSLINAVLKESNEGANHYSDDYLNNFLWYKYRFLGNKSKPASHVRLFSKLEDTYTPEQIKEKLPKELKRLALKTQEILEETIE
ncbi:ATP-dependent nuclease [Vibrio genomosp. F10]|uniref:ATP-dependent nuclease n=1 Tax=Vibrio genomosp. F10 TaxID=723171 RepID=UPI0003180A03|nr:AAA family ATPase [Vibrio genomosp. F10]OEF09561.1 ATP-dependent endonuclease [Vibrio genomosp. F10 str. 9ZB36]